MTERDILAYVLDNPSDADDPDFEALIASVPDEPPMLSDEGWLDNFWLTETE